MTWYPPVSGDELRPRRGWYVAAGLFGLGGILAGIVLFVWGVVAGATSLSGSLPQLTELRPGEPTAVTLEAGREQIVYVRDVNASAPPGHSPSAAPTPSAGATPDRSADCTGTGENGGTVTFTPYSTHGSLTYNTWTALHRAIASQDGTYRITCGAPSDTGVLFAIGDEVPVGKVVGGFAKIFGGLTVGLGLPCLGVLVGGVIALVTGLRRGSHRNRLLQQRAAASSRWPGHPPSSWGAPPP